jgi:hypothetical protein
MQLANARSVLGFRSRYYEALIPPFERRFSFLTPHRTDKGRPKPPIKPNPTPVLAPCHPNIPLGLFFSHSDSPIPITLARRLEAFRSSQCGVKHRVRSPAFLPAHFNDPSLGIILYAFISIGPACTFYVYGNFSGIDLSTRPRPTHIDFVRVSRCGNGR